MTPKWVFNPRTFLKLSKELINTKFESPDQCIYRTVVNRSYLAALQVASWHIQRRGITLQNDKNYYTNVRKNLLGMGVDPTYKDLLHGLQDLRVEADYRYGRNITQKDASSSIELATRFVDYLDKKY